MIAIAKRLAAIRTLARAGRDALVDALLAEDVAARLERRVLEVLAAHCAYRNRLAEKVTGLAETSIDNGGGEEHTLSISYSSL